MSAICVATGTGGGLLFGLIAVSTGTATWLHHDQLGSTRLLTNTSGTTIGTVNYDPYGNRTTHTGTAITPLGYTGEYTDTESGLSYLRARYYDPTTAQFLSVDPLAASTHQPYSYSDDTPTDNTDPSGLDCHGFNGCGLSYLEAAANGATFGLPGHIDDAISSGSTCTYDHDNLGYKIIYGTTTAASFLYGGGEYRTAEEATDTIAAADSGGGALARLKAAASGDRGAIGSKPTIGGEAANYGDDELAQLAFQHSGQGYANGEVRPSLDEIQGTISNGIRARLPGQNAIRIQTPSVQSHHQRGSTMEVDGVLPMRLSETANILIRFGTADRSLLDLIDGWCGHVMKLSEDATRPADDAWTVHDLIASLYVRDAVQRAMNSQRDDAESISAVAVADEMFKAITTEDFGDRLTRFDPDVPVSPWWWKRLPAHGPIADEIRGLKET